MNEQPFISVIIPVYNASLYLERCVNSVLAQKGVKIELILVNDGSTDDSPFICDNYAKNDERIKVIHQKNAGASVARNAGIMQSTGTWVAFVDSDDFIAPNMYQNLIGLAQKDHADAAFCDCYKWRNNEDKTYWEMPNCYANNKALTIYKQFKHSLGLLYTLVVKRSLLVQHHILFPTNITFSEDFHFVMHIKMAAHATTKWHSAPYFYNVSNENSLMHTLQENRILDELRCVLMLVKQFEHYQLFNEHKQIVYWRMQKVQYKLYKKKRYSPFFDSYPEIKHYLWTNPYLTLWRKIRCFVRGGIHLKKSWKPL